MNEQDEVLSDLSKAGVLAAARWAWISAHRMLWDDYNPSTGHSTTWLGLTAHDLFKDRLDRVFSCRGYGVHTPTDDGVGIDVLLDGVLPDEHADLLRLRMSTVQRADRTGSPGWRYGRYQWLLSSFRPDGIDKIDWRAKSDTKQRFIQEANPEDFDLFTDPQAVPARPLRTNLIFAHSCDGATGTPELYVGHPKIDDNSGSSWVWRVDMMGGPPRIGGRVAPNWPTTPPTSTVAAVADAPVRLKPRSDEQRQRDRR